MSEPMTEQNLVGKTISSINHSIGFKLFVIFGLFLILMIPSGMIQSLIHERTVRKQSVIQEINSKWGKEQTIAGPMFVIPYKVYYETEKREKHYRIHYFYLLPDTLDIKGQIYPEVRYRGIYQAVLYNTKLEISGNFPKPPIEEESENILWSGAYIALGISDMLGIKEHIDANMGNMPITMNPGMDNNSVVTSGVSAKIPMKDASSFRFVLNLNGSEQLYFIPAGKTTTVSLSSAWVSPSFDGAFLPESRQVDNNGFQAKWKVLHLNRNYPQYWSGDRNTETGSSAFGVKLFTAVDVYQKTTRTAKYAIMFIAFAFMSFFFSEVMNKEKVHPIQYLFIGIALLIFYTLLLSISEHLSFNGAYLISSIAIIGLISSYSKSILKSGKLSLLVGGILSLLYGYLYFVLQMEDYALLMGSIGLFAVMGAIMYLTRKIDWYSVKI